MSYAGCPITGYPFTVAGWAACTGGGDVWSLGNGSDANQFIRLYMGSGGQLLFTANFQDTSATPTYVTGDWMHVACVGESATSRKTYANGVLVATNTTSVAFPTLNKMAFGVLDRTTIIEPFGGNLAYFAFWSVALNATEVGNLAAGCNPGAVQTAGLLDYWMLAGYGSPEPSMTSGRSLTLTGTALDQSSPPVSVPWRRRPSSILVPGWAA